jgi:hypothetical protein
MNLEDLDGMDPKNAILTLQNSGILDSGLIEELTNFGERDFRERLDH